MKSKFITYLCVRADFSEKSEMEMRDYLDTLQLGNASFNLATPSSVIFVRST